MDNNRTAFDAPFDMAHDIYLPPSSSGDAQRNMQASPSSGNCDSINPPPHIKAIEEGSPSSVLTNLRRGVSSVYSSSSPPTRKQHSDAPPSSHLVREKHTLGEVCFSGGGVSSESTSIAHIPGKACFSGEEGSAETASSSVYPHQPTAYTEQFASFAHSEALEAPSCSTLKVGVSRNQSINNSSIYGINCKAESSKDSTMKADASSDSNCVCVGAGVGTGVGVSASSNSSVCASLSASASVSQSSNSSVVCASTFASSSASFSPNATTSVPPSSNSNVCANSVSHNSDHRFIINSNSSDCRNISSDGGQLEEKGSSSTFSAVHSMKSGDDAVRLKESLIAYSRDASISCESPSWECLSRVKRASYGRGESSASSNVLPSGGRETANTSMYLYPPFSNGSSAHTHPLYEKNKPLLPCLAFPNPSPSYLQAASSSSSKPIDGSGLPYSGFSEDSPPSFYTTPAGESTVVASAIPLMPSAGGDARFGLREGEMCAALVAHEDGEISRKEEDEGASRSLSSSSFIPASSRKEVGFHAEDAVISSSSSQSLVCVSSPLGAVASGVGTSPSLLASGGSGGGAISGASGGIVRSPPSWESSVVSSIPEATKTEERKASHEDQSASASRGSSGGAGHSQFECNICFDAVNEPVVSRCGHLFCWPCLHSWLNQGAYECPMCKACVTRENVIPLYGFGQKEADPRKRDYSTPKRPRPERIDPPRANRTGNLFRGVRFSINFIGFGGESAFEDPFRGISAEQQRAQFVSNSLVLIGIILTFYVLLII